MAVLFGEVNSIIKSDSNGVKVGAMVTTDAVATTTGTIFGVVLLDEVGVRGSPVAQIGLKKQKNSPIATQILMGVIIKILFRNSLIYRY